MRVFREKKNHISKNKFSCSRILQKTKEVFDLFCPTFYRAELGRDSIPFFGGYENKLICFTMNQRFGFFLKKFDTYVKRSKCNQASLIFFNKGA